MEKNLKNSQISKFLSQYFHVGDLSNKILGSPLVKVLVNIIKELEKECQTFSKLSNVRDSYF